MEIEPGQSWRHKDEGSVFVVESYFSGRATGTRDGEPYAVKRGVLLDNYELVDSTD
jgi:hypothetical protein